LGRCDENDSFTDLTIYSSSGLNSDTVDVSLFVVDLIEEFFLKRLSWWYSAVLSNSLLKLTINLELSEGNFFISTMSDIEDATIILVSIAQPHWAGLAEELFLDIHIPVFVLTVEFEVVSFWHVIDSKNAVIAIHCKILNSCNWCRNHLFKVVNFINMLGFSPEAIRAINKNKILVTVINHFANIIEVNVLKESKDWEHVEGVARTDNWSLHAVLNVHIFVVVTISITFGVPTRTILELLRDLPEVPVISHPR